MSIETYGLKLIPIKHKAELVYVKITDKNRLKLEKIGLDAKSVNDEPFRYYDGISKCSIGSYFVCGLIDEKVRSISIVKPDFFDLFFEVTE
jgi:hypothetical protein